MDGSNCCDQDRILKVFNLVDWKEVPQDDIKWIEEKAAKIKLENKDINDGQSRIHSEISELHRRLEAFEQQVSRLNERNEKIESDIKDIRIHPK